MNLRHLQNRLLRAARQHPPSAAAPYAFEKRIMSHLSTRQPESVLAWWAASLWRGAAACVAVTLLCGIWSYALHFRQAETGGDFSQEFQATVFASMNQSDGGDW